MCLGFEGVLIEATGTGVARRGLLSLDDRTVEIGLAFVPDARRGDRVLAHSGQGVRVVSSSSTKLIDRA